MNAARASFLVQCLVVVYTTELMLGGGGRLVTIGPLSLRMMIYGFFVFTFYLAALAFRTEIRNMAWNLAFGITGVVLFYGTVGIMNGATWHAVFMSANSYFTLLYLPLLIYYFNRAGLAGFFKLFMFCAMVIALFTVISFFLGVFGLIDLRQLDDILNNLAYGGNSGMMYGVIPRIHFVSQTVIQFAIAIALARILFEANYFSRYRWWAVIQNLILWLALVMTYTRGYWLGVIISIGILLYKAGLRRARLAVLFSGLIIALAVGGLIGSGSYGLATLASRFVSSFDTGTMEGNRGNLVRILEVFESAKQIRAHPILGVGFGVPMPASYYKTRTAITGKELEGTEFTIELSYLDLFRQVGIAGFTGCLIALWLLYRKTKLVLAVERPSSEYALILGYMSGIAGFLFTAGTNPYLMSSSGLFLIIVALAILWAKPGHYQSELQQR